MGKKIELSRKTITEDKDGNALVTGKFAVESSPVDAKDLTNKEYVDNAIAQAAIGGEIDTSGFALKTELPTKTSQLTNDSGFITSIPDEYVTSSEVQQMSEGFRAELDKKSNIINYSDHTLNGVETYNNLEKLNTSETSETEVIYIIDKSINLTKGSICSIEVKFSDNTNLLLQGEVVSNVLEQKEVNYIQIMGQTPVGIMLIDKAKYSIGDNNTTSIQHNDNASTLMVLHPKANNVISLIITKPTTFEINNSFFMDYQFVNDTEKENWNNKADKSELFSGDYNDLENKLCYDTRITERKTYTYTYSVSNMPEDGFIKISDDIYTVEEIKNFSNLTVTIDYMDDTASETYNYLTLSELDHSLIFMPDQSGDIGAAYICSGIVCIVLKNTENTSAGIYLNEDVISSNCTIEFSFDYLLSGEIKALDEKYLVNKPGRIVYTPCPDGCGDINVGEIFNSSLNKACGAFSHAEGVSTTANSMSAHAEGLSTKAMDVATHAEGFFTEANGTYSHAEGHTTIANGNYQHVQGKYNAPLGDSYAHIVGNGNSDTDRKNAHTLDWNGNAWFAGDVTVGADSKKLVTEESLPCYDTREIEIKEYTYDGTGTPFENTVKVSNDVFTLEDIRKGMNFKIECTLFSDNSSQKINMIKVDESDATLNCFTDDNGVYAVYITNYIFIVLRDADGYTTGVYLVHDSNKYISYFSFEKAISGDFKPLDEAFLTNKPGKIVKVPCNCEDEDCNLVYTGEIFNDTNGNKAGIYSHAEGLDTWALGEVSHSEGYFTKANGNKSHAEGCGCVTNAESAHAEGFGTIANGNSQHAQGRYNAPLGDSYAHIVGNGSSDTNRKNAHTLDWNGNAWFAGKATVSVQPTDNNDLTTKLYVDQSISQVNNDLQNQINELFQNVSSGKELIASAITDKGVDASEEETFQSLSEKINQIPVGPPGSNIIGYINENNDIYVSLTELESGTYTLKFEDYTGLLNEFDDIGTVEV